MDTELSRDEMIQKALELSASGNEKDINQAIFLLKKARSLPSKSYNYSDDLLSMYAYFLEAELGIGSTQDNFASFLLRKVSYQEGYNSRPYFYYIQENQKADLNYIKAKSPHLPNGISSFLNHDIGKIWVKALKFDALQSQLKMWEEEDKLDSERMRRIREILGE